VAHQKGEAIIEMAPSNTSRQGMAARHAPAE
jgi:hypothetical protein